MSKIRKKNRLLIECRLISTNKKIDDWLSLLLIYDHFRKLTMRQIKMKFNYRFQKRNFFINANSRSFSLIYDAHNENKMQLSFSKRKFQIDDFLLIRVFLRMIRRFFFEHSRIFTNDENFVLIRFLYEQLTIFFWFAYFYEHIWRFYLIIRVFRRAICFKTKRLIECQLISQNSKREICCVENNESSLRIDENCVENVIVANWKISCWKCNRHELNNRVSFYSLILRMWNLHRSSR